MVDDLEQLRNERQKIASQQNSRSRPSRERESPSRQLAREHLPRQSLFLLLTKEDTMATEQRETGRLIGSDKVEGTAVYGADNEKIGSIERVMIEKTSGQVSYAVLSFGGFLGLGDDHYPVPWKLLKYDTELGGYRTGISGNRLKGAPKHGTETVFDWSARSKEVDDYYTDGRGIVA
jgi:hypothetical protein